MILTEKENYSREKGKHIEVETLHYCYNYYYIIAIIILLLLLQVCEKKLFSIIIRTHLLVPLSS